MSGSAISHSTSSSSSVNIAGSPAFEEKYLGSQDRGSPLKDYLLENMGSIRESGTGNDVIELRKKISDMELKQAEQHHVHNEELVKAQSEITRLRAAYEKDQVSHQKLQYELTLANKRINQERRKATDKEQDWLTTNKKLQGLQSQVCTLEEKLSNESASKEEDIKALNEAIANKDLEVKQKEEDLRRCSEELSKLDSHTHDILRTNEELEDRCRTLENQRNSQSDTLRKLVADLQLLSDKEERAREELEECREKLRTTDDNLEGERTANLQAKFNSDVLQLRIRELETSLNAERTTNGDLKYQTSELLNDKRELEAALDKQKEAFDDLKSLMISKDDQHCTEVNRLLKELNESQQVVSKLSQELEVHQNNFDDLKNELTETKKKQTNLEDTYGNSMRELELLIDKFCPNSFEEGKAKKGKRFDKMKSIPPAMVLGNLRRMLSDYQKRVNQYSTETEKFKESLEKLSSECDMYKELVWTKDKGLEEKTRQLKEAEEKIAHLRSCCNQYDRQAAIDKDQMHDLQSILREEKQRLYSTESDNQIFDRENAHLKNSVERTEEAFLMFLHSCHQHLTDYRDLAEEKLKESFEASKIPQQSQKIVEEIQQKMSELRTSQDQVSELQSALNASEKELSELKQNYNSTVSQSSKNIQEREVGWKKQKILLKRNYDELVENSQREIEELHTRMENASKEIQTLNDLRITLEAQNQKLKNAVFQLQHEKSCLLTSCTLISGTLWPAYAKLNLASDKVSPVSRLSKSLHYLKTELARIVTIMNTEMDENMGNVRPNHKSRDDDVMPPLLRFRVAAIAIMAINRIVRLGNRSKTLFISTKCPGRGEVFVPFFVGGCDASQDTEKGRSKRKREKYTTAQIVAWLSCPRLVPIASKAVGHLVEEVQKFTIGGEQFPSRFTDKDSTGKKCKTCNSDSVKTLTSTAHSKLINLLEPEFSSSNEASQLYIHRTSGTTLSARLGEALSQMLKRKSRVWRWHKYSSSETLIGELQQHLLMFTQRLHTAEKERRTLRNSLTKLKEEKESLGDLVIKEKEELAKVQEDEFNLHDRLKELREEMGRMVPVSKFQSVCGELSAALRREEETQILLQEQTEQLKEMERRIEVYNQRVNDKDQSLSEAWKALAEAKSELIKREHRAKRLKQSVSDFEMDKERIIGKLAESESNLKAVIREREVFLNFLKAAEIALSQSKQQMKSSSSESSETGFIFPELLLPEEQLALEGISISRDMKVCQKSVQTFLQVHQQSLLKFTKLQTINDSLERKVSLLKGEIDTHQKHTLSLKDELRAVCRRKEIEDQLTSLQSNQSLKVSKKKLDKPLTVFDLPSPGAEFVPLRTMVESDNDTETNKVGSTAIKLS